MHHVCVHADGEAEELSGHALMASCPPKSYIANHPESPYPHGMPVLPAADLMKLLNFSQGITWAHEDWEVTPIVAWSMILRDARARQLTVDDFRTLLSGLLTKVQCYGYV